MAIRVVDATALAALAFAEPAGAEVARRLGDAALAAPHLIDTELTEACRQRCLREPERAPAFGAGLAALAQLKLARHPVDAGGVLALALKADLRANEASYLWLARELGAELVTIDARLAAAASADVS